MTHLEVKRKIYFILDDMEAHVSTAHQSRALRDLVSKLAEVSYIDGREMAHRLLRLKLGLDVPSDTSGESR